MHYLYCCLFVACSKELTQCAGSMVAQDPSGHVCAWCERQRLILLGIRTWGPNVGAMSAMYVRAVRALNSPEQWMHLNPTACGAFAFAGALSPVRDAGMRIPEVVFTMQFKLKLQVNCSAFMVVCRDSLHPTTKYERNKNVPTNVSSPQCMVSCNSFAIQVRLNHDCKRQWQRHVEFKN